jgi:Tol biopolymer transport system component
MLRKIERGARGERMRRALTTTSKSTDRFTALAVLFAVALAAGLLMLAGTKPAEAAFPGINGKTAFMSDRTTGAGVDNPTGDFEIFTINQGGTGLTQLTFNTATESQPNWSPNGKQITVTSDRDGNFEVYTMSADGSNQLNRSQNAALDWQPNWSSDGQHIVFTSDRDGNDEIYRMQVNGSLQTLLSNNPAKDQVPDWQPLKKRLR